MTGHSETGGTDDFVRIAESLDPVLRSYVVEADPDPGPNYQYFANDEICNSTCAALIKALKFLSYLLSPVPKHASILDVGSGYGLNCILLGLLGFRRVTGIELVDPLYENSVSLLDYVRSHLPYDLSGLEILKGDIQRSSFADASFDCLLCVEVLSHVASQDALLKEANRLLRLGGLVIVSDGCNITDPRAHRRLRQAWARVRREEMADRLRYLAEHHPDLDPDSRIAVALHTELLGRRALEEALPGIKATGDLPAQEWTEGTAPVYFESGIWAENGIQLADLERRFCLYGFQPRVRVSFGGCRGAVYHAAETCLNLLPRALRYRARPVFRCWAEKVGSCS